MNMWWLKPTALAMLIAVAVAAGYWRGKEDCQARHDAAALERIAKEAEADAERVRLQRELDEIARQLEEEINEAPVVISRCLAPDRGVQLNRIR